MAAAGEKARFCDGGVDKEGIAGEMSVCGGLCLGNIYFVLCGCGQYIGFL